jgi:hypothetical protein
MSPETNGILIIFFLKVEDVQGQSLLPPLILDQWVFDSFSNSMWLRGTSPLTNFFSQPVVSRDPGIATGLLRLDYPIPWPPVDESILRPFFEICVSRFSAVPRLSLPPVHALSIRARRWEALPQGGWLAFLPNIAVEPIQFTHAVEAAENKADRNIDAHRTDAKDLLLF